VSTKEQAQNLSLPTQLRACREYCSRHGLKVVAVFEDAGESAKTTDRPEFKRLLEYCRTKKGQVEVLVVYNVTRFARNAYDHAIVRTLLHRLGVSLRSVNEPIGDDSVGKLTENMLAAIAQFDNDVKSERTKAGMVAALERGRWTWRAPLGYLRGAIRSGEPSLIPDPERAPLVQKAFALVGSGEQVTDTLTTITALGLKTLKGDPLTPQTLGAMLRNEIYAGYVNAPGFDLKGIRGDFSPLVPEVLFTRVQNRLAAGGSSPQSKSLDNPRFPLRRFVKCDRCDLPLTGSASKGRSSRYGYYHCRKCSGVNIRSEALERQFLDMLEALRPKADFMPLFKLVVLDVWNRRLADTVNVRAALEARLTELRRREEVLEAAYLFEKRVDAITYDRQRDKLREDIALVRMELEQARLDEIDVEGLLDFAEHVLNNAAHLWLDAPPELKRRLQTVIFPEGLRFRDGKIGTATTCLAFSQLQGIDADREGLASPRGRRILRDAESLRFLRLAKSWAP
jgi:DNA invertase Pin-like site-specific DNA recombinase